MHGICYKSAVIYSSLAVDTLFIVWLVGFPTVLDSFLGRVVAGGLQLYKIFHETET